MDLEKVVVQFTIRAIGSKEYTFNQDKFNLKNYNSINDIKIGDKIFYIGESNKGLKSNRAYEVLSIQKKLNTRNASRIDELRAEE